MREVTCIVAVALATGLSAFPAVAHGGSPHLAGDYGWTFDPLITAPLALAGLLFALGALRLFRRSGQGRRRLRKQVFLFAAGWISLALALVSPLHQAGEHSFTLHMIEHEILMLVATPLLVLSRPLPILLWAFKKRERTVLGGYGFVLARSSFWRFLTNAWVATILQGVAMWLWHAPILFNRAVENDGWHIAQHLSFLVTAFLFWSAVLDLGQGSQDHGRRALSAFCLFVTSLVGGALGALMALSESPWYESYLRQGSPPFGLTATEDQQLAGLVMWLPGGMVHAGAALVLAASLFSASGEKAVRHVR